MLKTKSRSLQCKKTLPCSYKFLLTFFIHLCSNSIESFILSVSYEKVFRKCFLGGYNRVLMKNQKNHRSKSTLSKGYSKKTSQHAQEYIKRYRLCMLNQFRCRKNFWGGGVLKQILEVSYSFLQRQYEGEKLIEKMQKQGGG